MFNVTEYLRHTAARHPSVIAIRCDGQSTTYGELDERANRYANIFRELGLSPGDRVGLLAEKSAETVAAMQGCARADGVYVPMDAHFPSNRLHNIAAHCGFKIVVCDEEAQHHIPELVKAGVTTVVMLEGEGAPVDGCRIVPNSQVDSTPAAVVVPNRGRDDVAKILYTSGSTGEPKGVLITHGNLTSHIDWTSWYFKIELGERHLNHSKFTFDLAGFDLYTGFLAGATVVLLREEDALFPAATVKLIEQEQITSILIVPSAMISLMNRGGLLKRDSSRLKRVLYSGEAFPVPPLRTLAAWLKPGTVLVNMYGPIETNNTTMYRVTDIPESWTAMPVGHAINGNRISIRNEEGEPCAAETKGEIWVSGPSVTLGYWKNEEITKQKIVYADNERWYKTGDMGSLGRDGLIHFHGRTDQMIKSRGYRIELGDIEAAMISHPLVVEAAAVARPDPAVGSVLYGYFVARDALAAADLKSHLSKVLPPYMVPQQLFVIDSLPKTNSGKVSRRALLDELENRLAEIKSKE